MPKVVVVFGTRPEAIKLAPVIARLRAMASIEVRVVLTGQHSLLLDQSVRMFGIAADHRLDIMTEEQTLFDISCRVLARMAPILEAERPDLVIVQGDTSTACMTALSCFYMKIPVAHVEAGLRTGDAYDPFPEEKNRQIVATLCDIHFAPTEQARKNLLREAIPPEKIFVTGNTVVDTLMAYLRTAGPVNGTSFGSNHKATTEKILLVTAHRRENHGPPIEHICTAIEDIVHLDPGLRCVFPVHPHPRVRSTVETRLKGKSRIDLIAPLAYGEFIALMQQCWLVLTDSGGIQEEAPTLGKPVLVLRNHTERPEGIRAGIARLVGTEPSRIVGEVRALLSDPERYQRMVPRSNPYGDGKASERIAHVVHSWLARQRS